MIDLHCHLLYGIDDGPNTLEESLELCQIAVADGVTQAVVTPHIHPGRWENTRLSIGKSCDDMQRELERRDIPLRLGFAAEVRLTDQIMQQLANEEIPFYGTVDGYRVMLLEFPHGHIIPGSEKLVSWLLDQGIRPLLAHPERNRQVMRDISLLQPFLDAGCWLQLTAGSVLGRFGENSQAVADKLLRDDAVSVIASDGHNARARPPVLGGSFAYIASTYGMARAERLFQDTPAAIACGQFGDDSGH